MTAAAAALWINGCTAANTGRGVQPDLKRIELPQSGELEVHARALSPVGNVLPLEVSITNLADRARVLRYPAVGGITESGEVVPDLAVDDPAVAANADALRTKVSGGQGAVDEALAASWAGKGGWGWVIASGPFGWTELAINSAIVAHSSPSSRLELYSLEMARPARKDMPLGYLATGERVTGYVFLPRQNYKALRVTVINLLTHNEEVMTVPWNSEIDLSQK